jgi:hypothetical protein
LGGGAGGGGRYSCVADWVIENIIYVLL